MFDPIVLRSLGEDTARKFVTQLLTALAHLRALAGEAFGFGGKRLPGVETHLWVREVSRIERAVTPTEDGQVFRFADDGHIGAEDSAVWLPAIYCRECGRAGWMTALEPGTDAVVLDGAEIRKASVDKPELPRPLIDATNEYRRAVAEGMEPGAFDGEDGKRALMWFHTSTRTLITSEPSDEDRAEGRSVPVLTYAGLNATEYAREQVCPNCGGAGRGALHRFACTGPAPEILPCTSEEQEFAAAAERINHWLDADNASEVRIGVMCRTRGQLSRVVAGLADHGIDAVQTKKRRTRLPRTSQRDDHARRQGNGVHPRHPHGRGQRHHAGALPPQAPL